MGVRSNRFLPVLVPRVVSTLLPVLVLVALVPPSADARCLSYHPSVVTLVGELSSRQVPGPPNYRNLARGDLPETILVLKLVEAICVSGDPDSSTNRRSHAGVEEVQLEMALSRARALVGKRVRVTGTLSAAQTGHHRTPVVMSVKAMREDLADDDS